MELRSTYEGLNWFKSCNKFRSGELKCIDHSTGSSLSKLDPNRANLFLLIDIRYLQMSITHISMGTAFSKVVE